MGKVVRAIILLCVSTAALAQPVDRPQLRVKPTVLLGDQVASAFVIPVAGSTPGALNTFFRTEVVLSNFADAAQRVRITTIPRAASGQSSITRFFTLPSYANRGDLGLTSEDFWGSELNSTGLGAILVEAVDANGNIQTNARIDGVARVYTPLPSNIGTNIGNASQSLLSVPTNHLQGNEFSAFALGMRMDENYRMNVGIVNLSTAQLTWRVDVFGTRGDTTFNVTVPGNSFDQVNVPAGNYGFATVAFTLLGGNADTRWTAYAASVDNKSGDGWNRNANY